MASVPKAIRFDPDRASQAMYEKPDGQPKLIKEDVLNRELKFKTETGETVTFHGSWRKETIK
jgi:hypothetical protein